MQPGADVLTLGEMSPADVRQLLDRAAAQKAAWARGNHHAPYESLTAALIFLKPSMRTRVSFEVACDRLGLRPVVLGPGDAFSRNETIEDTTRVLERYVDVIVIRAFEQAMVERVAAAARVPVINALTDDYHPCQVLADLLTILEHKGRLEGLKLAYVGDGNNMANTLLIGCAQVGMHITCACPEGYDPLPAAGEAAARIAAGTGATVGLSRDPVAAVTGADVVVTDTWASMGREAEREARIAALSGFQVNAGLMAHANPDAIFMHCLPAHRGEEVTDEVIDASYSVVLDEAENRLHAQKALLSALIGG
jgi:ornithine carbamoyltransferase